MLSLGNADLFFFIVLKQGLKLKLFLFLLFSSPISPLFFVKMERRAEGSTKFYETLPHLHLFVVLNRQIFRNFYDVFLIEGEFRLTFDVRCLRINCMEAVEVLMF